MNILEICQDAASLVSTQKPLDLFNRDSQQEAIFLSIIKDTLESLRRYGDWQELTKEGSLRTIKGKTSYYISDFCPDFFSLMNNTVFVKDKNERVIGSITPEQWMRERYFSVPSIDLKFKIQNNCFRFLTSPEGNLKIVFSYRSANIVYDSANDTCGDEKGNITKNTDIPLFDPHLVKLGVAWRWYKRNGMPYEEEFNEYNQEVKKQFGTGLATKDINLAGVYIEELEGVCVNAVKGN